MSDNRRRDWSVGSYDQEGRRASGLEGKQFDAQVPTMPKIRSEAANAADPGRRNKDGASSGG